MTGRPPFWNARTYAARRPFLVERAAIVKALRAYFAEFDYFEVETPALQVSGGNETHIHAFGTELISPADRGERRYLRTSPEFTCKKLLAAGESRIVEFARVFRNRERSPLHHPEFTLIEWYRAHGRYELLMDDCMSVIQRAAHAVATRRFSYRDRTADPFADAERLTVAEAFERYANIDLLGTLTPVPDRRRFAVVAHQAGVDSAIDDNWGDIFSRVLVEKIEPHLGNGRATILCEYPSVMSALARPKRADPRVAERFELYLCGVELANGFGEQNDPTAQRARLEAEMDEKERIYGERYPIDEDFIAALKSIKSACGVALGLDRLVMLATGANHIEKVLWAPVAE
jgi:elongation factor P--(R)-beta-lysine ligase